MLANKMVHRANILVFVTLLWKLGHSVTLTIETTRSPQAYETSTRDLINDQGRHA